MDLTARPVLIGLGFIIVVCGAVVLWVEHNSAAPMEFIERHLGFSPVAQALGLTISPRLQIAANELIQ